MAKMRISEFAKNHNSTSAKILEIARSLNIAVKTHSSNISDEEQNIIIEYLAKESSPKDEHQTEQKADVNSFPKVAVGLAPTLQEVAQAMKVPFGVLAKNLMLAGMMKPPTSKADDKTLEVLSQTFKLCLVREEIRKDATEGVQKKTERTEAQNIEEIENI